MPMFETLQEFLTLLEKEEEGIQLVMENHSSLPEATWTEETGTEHERATYGDKRRKIMMMLKCHVVTAKYILNEGRKKFFPNGGMQKDTVINARNNFLRTFEEAKERVVDVGEELLKYGNIPMTRALNERIVIMILSDFTI